MQTLEQTVRCSDHYRRGISAGHDVLPVHQGNHGGLAIVRQGGSILLFGRAMKAWAAPEFTRMVCEHTSDNEFLRGDRRRAGDHRPMAAGKTRAGTQKDKCRIACRECPSSSSAACGDRAFGILPTPCAPCSRNCLRQPDRSGPRGTVRFGERGLTASNSAAVPLRRYT